MARTEKVMDPKKKLLDEKVINISRVTKVTKGGRHFRFSAALAVGDGKGLVGIRTGKSNEVPEAIKKGLLDSNYDEENILILNRVVDAYKELEKLVGEKEVFALFENDLPDIYNEGGMKK